jgi:RNA polymerase sigma factor (sigma-70 family)
MNGLPASIPVSFGSSHEHARWFVEEVQPHEPSLRAYLRVRFPDLADPDDLVQETYLRLLRARESGKERLNKGYIFTVARNAALDLCRRNRVVSFERITDLERLPVLEHAPNAADAASHQQEVAILIEAIQALPERCRQVITLRKIYNLTHKEIAMKLGIAENTVNAQVTLGMARLRDYLRAHGVGQ